MRERIAFVCQRYGEDVNGGAEAYCRQIAEKLTAFYDVDVYTTCARDYMIWENVYPEGMQEDNGVHVLRFPVERPRRKWVKKGLSVWMRLVPFHSDRSEEAWLRAQGPVCEKALNTLWNSQDQYVSIFFMTYLYYLTAFGIPRGFRRAVLIPTIHDEKPARLRWFHRVFSACSGIVWNSPEERDFAHRVFPESVGKPSILAGIGVECPRNLPERHVLPEKDCPYVVYVGRIDPEKGCREMLDAFVRFARENPHQLRLVLVGRSVMTVPDHPDILQMGFLEEREKWQIMRDARGLVLFSRNESLSMVALESMCLGRPILVSAESSVLRGHVVRSRAGIVFRDQASFEKGLLFLTKDSESYVNMGENGKRYIQENYSWQMITGRYVSLIEQMKSLPEESGRA